MARSRKGFREVIEQHPLTSLVIVASAAVGSTFGVMTYFHQAKGELETLEAGRKLAIQSQEFEKKVGYLEGRLASIERRVGSDKASYFDVAALVTTRDATRGLDKSFTFYNDLNCYIAIPTTEQWTHEITNEVELASKILGQEIPKDSPLFAAAAAFKVHLWRGSDVFEVNTGDDDIPKLHLFPFVLIQSVENSQLAKIVGGAIAEESRLDKKESNELKEILRRLEDKDAHIESAGESPAGSTEALPAPSSSPSLEAEKLEATEILNRIFRSDFAGFVLVAQLTGLQRFQQILKESSVELTNVDKKGNVLYFHVQITFIDSVTKLPIYWDREVFFVTGAKRSFIVATSAPSVDRRSASAPWITSWLSSLRIPLE